MIGFFWVSESTWGFSQVIDFCHEAIRFLNKVQVLLANTKFFELGPAGSGSTKTPLFDKEVTSRSNKLHKLLKNGMVRTKKQCHYIMIGNRVFSI